MRILNSNLYFKNLLSSTKLCGGALFLAFSFTIIPNDSVYGESLSSKKYDYRPNYVNNRVIAQGRYRMRPKDSIQKLNNDPVLNKAVPALNVVSLKSNVKRKDGLYQRPKTELSIRPMDYYNNAVQTQSTPVLQPFKVAEPKNVVLPWLHQSNDVAPKVMPVSEQLVEQIKLQPEPQIQAQQELTKIEPKLVNEVKVEQELAQLDLSRQPVQVEQLKPKLEIVEPIKPQAPTVDEKVQEPVIKEVLLPKQFSEPDVLKTEVVNLELPNENVQKKNEVIEQQVAPETNIERVDDVPEIQTNEPQPQPISNETNNILQKLPREIFPKRKFDNSKVDLERAVSSPNNIGENPSVEGMVEASVAVRRQAFDVNYELDKAYNALVNGNTEVAVRTYRDVLNNEPNNKFALFGLATTYHKLSMMDKARPLYGRLLELDPYNKEALNNFLALVGEEAPESAIMYLEQLKSQNNDFSPIYAQLAQLYAKSGNMPLAIENMQEASMISPENLVYKYNLAVLYDKAKQKDRAIILYRQLMKAGLDGADLPANLSDIQKRLTFLSSNNG